MKDLLYQCWGDVQVLDGLLFGNAVDVEADRAPYVLDEVVEGVSLSFAAYRNVEWGWEENVYYLAIARNVDGAPRCIDLDVASKCFTFADGCHVTEPIPAAVMKRFAYIGDRTGELLVDCGISGWLGDVVEVYSEDGEWMGAGVRFRVDSGRREPEEIWSMLLENFHAVG